MSRYEDEVLSRWTAPPSNTEQEKFTNAERMVKDALDADDILKQMNLHVFCQGSYANNTNIKLDSDIDINVNYQDAFYYELPSNLTKENMGFSSGYGYSFSKFKNDVEKALITKFGQENIIRRNKCISIKQNSYHAKIDVVPTWKHRHYSQNKSYAEGVCLFSDNGEKKTINYPLQHIENGKTKNEHTSRRYKSLVRIFKRAMVEMEKCKFYIDNNISSFLLECLIWNCPDSVFIDHNSWNERVENAIFHIYKNTKDLSTPYKEWREVSNLLYLFNTNRKWTRNSVNQFMIKLWNFMEY